MATLEFEKQRRVDEFHFRIMIDGPELKRRKRKGDVVIVFENCEFAKCDYAIPRPLTREQWKIMGIIDKKISELEEHMKVEKEKKHLKYKKISE